MPLYEHERGTSARIILERAKDPTTGLLPKYVWPGGYPIYYMASAQDGEVICADCANKLEGDVDTQVEDKCDAYDCNWEAAHLTCDVCNEQIECAYVECTPQELCRDCLDNNQNEVNTQMTDKLNLNQFEEWLKAKAVNPNPYVGTRQSNLYCPLACYLNQTDTRTRDNPNGTGRWSVGRDCARYRPVGNLAHTIDETVLPRWARLFLVKIDGGMLRDVRIGDVTVDEAFRALEDVKEIINEHEEIDFNER